MELASLGNWLALFAEIRLAFCRRTFVGIMLGIAGRNYLFFVFGFPFHSAISKNNYILKLVAVLVFDAEASKGVKIGVNITNLGNHHIEDIVFW